jgi:GNAT superfamily N-acetyltransferase
MNVPSEWQRLSGSLITTPGIKISRVGAKRLHALYTKGMTYTLIQEVCDKREILAFGALWPTKDRKWLEIGTLYVSDPVAGNGIASLMVRSLKDLAKRLQKNVLMVTSNPKIVAVATSLDFGEDDTSRLSICATALTENRDLGGRKIFYSITR